MSPFETAAARREVAELLAAKRWNRIIVDVTALQSVPKAVELFESGGALPQTAPRSPWIALVVRPDQSNHARRIEKMAQDDGVFLTSFIDPEEAHAWVLGEQLGLSVSNRMRDHGATEVPSSWREWGIKRITLGS